MSENEKYNIKRKYTNLALGLLGLILIYILVSAFVFKKVTFVYNIVIVAGLALFWVIIDIVAPIKAHEFDDKTPEQMAAYKKYAASDLLGYAGLMYFALAMTSNTGIYGAIVYLIGRMLKNRFRDEYEGKTDDSDEDEAAESGSETGDAPGEMLTEHAEADSISEEFSGEEAGSAAPTDEDVIPAAPDPAGNEEISEEQYGSV